MEQLTFQDTQKLLRAIESLYKIASLDTFGRDTLTILEELMPTERSVFLNGQVDLAPILNLLRPHLFQAYSNALRFDRLQQNFTQLHQDIEQLGLIILNITGQIELMTSLAIEYLQTYFPQSVNTLYLPDLLCAWVRHQIASPTELFDARLPLRIQQNGKQLVIRLLCEPETERYLLLLEEQTLSLRPLLEMLGLSHRETEVLYWVIRGKQNKEIAQHLSIHLTTARTHLESIFRKLGVQSRTEAIAKALERLGLLN
jgi:DNA-binding CsgD family transcriptional regulator